MDRRNIVSNTSVHVDTLQNMFPAWDRDVLLDLLEANDGNLERTIDLALSMEPQVANQSTNATTSHDSRSNSTLIHSSYSQESSNERKRSNRKNRIQLPDDFLQLPGSTHISEQEQQDALLAQMLQNEIFRNELLADEEFSSHLRSRPSYIERERTEKEKSASEMASETLSAMGTKLSSMSTAMKKRMYDAYLQFQTGSNPRTDQYTHKPLMQSDSSDEEDHATSQFPTSHSNIQQRNQTYQRKSSNGWGSSYYGSGHQKKD